MPNVGGLAYRDPLHHVVVDLTVRTRVQDGGVPTNGDAAGAALHHGHVLYGRRRVLENFLRVKVALLVGQLERQFLRIR